MHRRFHRHGFIRMKMPDCIRFEQVHKSGRRRIWLPFVQCAQAGGDAMTAISAISAPKDAGAIASAAVAPVHPVPVRVTELHKSFGQLEVL